MFEFDDIQEWIDVFQSVVVYILLFGGYMMNDGIGFLYEVFVVFIIYNFFDVFGVFLV